jgi:hypothetical protein
MPADCGERCAAGFPRLAIEDAAIELAGHDPASMRFLHTAKPNWQCLYSAAMSACCGEQQSE